MRVPIFLAVIVFSLGTQAARGDSVSCYEVQGLHSSVMSFKLDVVQRAPNECFKLTLSRNSGDFFIYSIGYYSSATNRVEIEGCASQVQMITADGVRYRKLTFNSAMSSRYQGFPSGRYDEKFGKVGLKGSISFEPQFFPDPTRGKMISLTLEVEGGPKSGAKYSESYSASSCKLF